ncbi:MAG TPA: MarR family transcriptional regulator [Bryobacteraceae bacterium]|nr:MarR family transcriptional regulator [Bryobacteraceae bacterium]
MHAVDTETTPSLLPRQLEELIAHFDVLYQRLMLTRPLSSATEVEISRQEARVVVLLGGKGSMIMSDLARAANLALSSATNTVDRLVHKEMVDRTRVDEDRRVVQVGLSEKGKKYYDTLNECRLEMGRNMLEALSAGEREIFLELMAKMTRPVDGSAEAPPFGLQTIAD